MAIFSDTEQHIKLAAQMLHAGKLVAFPTETVYGLGANACEDAAVAAIFAAKNRPSFNPLISHFKSLEAVQQILDLNREAVRLAKHYWPGPLTLVVNRPAGCPISLLASAGQSSVAIRVPAHPTALKLLQQCDFPVVAPSANPSGRISPSHAQHVLDNFSGQVEMILDGGWCETGIESTVLDCRDDARIRLLRPGPISVEMLEAELGIQTMLPDGDQTDKEQPVISPGQLESHYAPNASVRLNAEQPDDDEAYLSFNSPESPYPHHFSLSANGDLTEAAANLFKMLHAADACGKAVIAVAPIPDIGIGAAINDRLRRAAAPRT